MLKSLHIKNYRAHKELKIDSLEKINLIIGKNNTGKSSLLEAIAIYAGKGEILSRLLRSRGEDYANLSSDNTEAIGELNKQSFSSLVNSRVLNQGSGFSIGEIQNVANTFKMRFESILVKNSSTEPNFDELKDVLQIEFSNLSRTLPLEDTRFLNRAYIVHSFLSYKENYQFVSSENIENHRMNSSLFDDIVLTDKEKSLVEGLKIIEPEIEKIAFAETGLRIRRPVVKLESISEPVPLMSMGDGINKILNIMLRLINADKGYLLIDEFENGLHYSVQEKLWEIIYKLSNELDVQVFATTHSEDCISTFENVLNSDRSTGISGKVIRLDNKDGLIFPVEFNKEELRIATDQNIEIR